MSHIQATMEDRIPTKDIVENDVNNPWSVWDKWSNTEETHNNVLCMLCGLIARSYKMVFILSASCTNYLQHFVRSTKIK